MARSVLYESDQGFIGFTTVPGSYFVQKFAQHIRNLKIGLFVIASDIVNLSHCAVFKDLPDGGTVIAHIEPVTHLPAVTVKR